MKDRIRIVSASAGSGKTTRLAAEIERAVLLDGVAPDRIVATTFTRRAAAELIERGRRALLSAERHVEADLFGAARIGTVNAVAGILVADFAFEAGISPAPIVLDEVRARQAFRRSLGQVVTRDDLAELTRLAGRFDDLDFQTIVQKIADAARTNAISLDALAAAAESSVEGFLGLLDPPAAEDLDARLLAALAQATSEIRARLAGGADATKASRDVLERYEPALHRIAVEGALPWPEWAWLLTGKAGAKSDAACAPVRRAAAAFLAHPRFRDDCETAVRLSFDLARRALAAYQRFKTERRAIDFIDQETIALALLQRDDVRDILAEEIALVLVDEFQDVSPLQLALFLALAKIAPRSVWVGDQKQAIYGFRGADPALMESVVAELLGGREPETLGVGRRSRPPLVHLTNALFAPPFANTGLPSSRVVLEPASAQDAAALGPAVERWRLQARKAADAISELARGIRHLLDDARVQVRDRRHGDPRPLRADDVAVLCRRRQTCLAVATALADLGVRARVAQAGLLRTPEGRAALAGLRLWIDDSDMLARAELARLLAPEAAGVDALLCGEDTDRWLGTEGIARLLAARGEAPEAGAVEAFDTVLERLGLDDLVVWWGRGAQGIANLDALRAAAVGFVQLAQHHGGTASPAALLAHLAELAEDGEDAQATADRHDAVDVLTWHGGKGLEWPVVVLFEIDSRTRDDALGVHVDDSRAGALRLDAPLAGRTIRYWPTPFHANSSRTPFHERLGVHPVSAAMAEAEERQALRLLYVGWTRARDRLVLAGHEELAKGQLELLARGGGMALAEPDAPGAGPGVTETEVSWGGESVRVAVRRPPPPAPLGAAVAGSAEILLRPEPREHPPARLRPSEAVASGRVLRVEHLGPAITLSCAIDPLLLGSGVHAFLAADAPGLDEDDRRELAARLLHGWGLAEAVRLEDLLDAGRRFSQWLVARWAGGRVHREWPVEHRLPEGTIVHGKIDVVVETEDALAVIDHKIIAAPEARALAEAGGYAGQLRLYAAAMRAATRRTAIETLVHLPLSGIVAAIG